MRGLQVFALFIVGFARVLIPSANAEDADAALAKANAYIEMVKSTERAVESWERYQSWVDMKTGPTGKEEYIDYGMYDVSDPASVLKDARAAIGTVPKTETLDAAARRYMDAYEALAPSMNEAAAYYDSKAYQADNLAKGQELHKTMQPLAKTLLAERETMLAELRPFMRDVEGQELAALEASEGRKAA